MSNCYRCGTGLNEGNQSVEHIIPNSIGGRLKSSHLLCVGCNSFYGSNFDCEISKQLGFQAHLLNVKTDRPLPEKIIGYTKEGDEFAFAPGMKNLEKLTLVINNKRVEYFNNTIQMQKFLRQKTKEMRNKGKQAEHIPYTRLAGDTVYFKNSLSTEIGTLGFGGELYFKAISRIAINFFLYKGGDLTFVKDSIENLENSSSEQNCWFYYSDTNIFIDEKEGEIAHTVVLKGDPSARILYAYINLFSCHSHLIRLSLNYTGPKINWVFSYDCINDKEIEKEEWLYVTMPILRDYTLLNHEKRIKFSQCMRENAMNKFFDVVQKRMNNKVS